MRVVGLLHQRARQTSVVGELDLEQRSPPVDVAQGALDRIDRLLARRGLKLSIDPIAPIAGDGDGKVLLRREVAEERAFRHAGRRADVVDCRGGVALGLKDPPIGLQNPDSALARLPAFPTPPKTASLSFRPAYQPVGMLASP